MNCKIRVSEREHFQDTHSTITLSSAIELGLCDVSISYWCISRHSSDVGDPKFDSPDLGDRYLANVLSLPVGFGGIEKLFLAVSPPAPRSLTL